jgi:hypothetical protein
MSEIDKELSFEGTMQREAQEAASRAMPHTTPAFEH